MTMLNNTLVGNVAAGSDRLGYWLVGLPCGAAAGAFANNSAHSSLVGLVLRANDQGAPCTQLSAFSTFLNWDFGLLTMKGITTDVRLVDIVAADNKHTGLLVLRAGGLAEPASVELAGALLVGQSEADVCAMCARSADPGCHQRLSGRSYNRAAPFSASLGLQSSVFATEFTSGPEKKAWDHVMGYAMVLGAMRVTNATFASFRGAAGCGAQVGVVRCGAAGRGGPSS
jgi:hypothetical protein